MSAIVQNRTAVSSFAVKTGDVMRVLAELSGNTFHGCLTDPPYHLTQASRGGSPRNNNPETPYGRTKLGSAGFMGKTWDGGNIAFRPELWAEVLRVLKPGAMLLAFGGTRTHHRLMCAIEDAGFEIRDCCMWLYGSGFPKSLDISKAIDKDLGFKRPIVSIREEHNICRPKGGGDERLMTSAGDREVRDVAVTVPASEEAKEWDGYGTALKPAWEPIILAMKPCAGSFANNALTNGVSGLNIDGCRIASGADHKAKCESVVGLSSNRNGSCYSEWNGERESSWTPLGRWPSNLLLNEESAQLLDEQSGDRPGCTSPSTVRCESKFRPNQGAYQPQGRIYADSGGASRFFYIAKADSAERHASGKNTHPCVKPIDLNSYLGKLILPPGESNKLLVPFSGSGSEIIGALRAGWTDVTGIEQDPEYVELSKRRIREDAPLFNSE